MDIKIPYIKSLLANEFMIKNEKIEHYISEVWYQTHGCSWSIVGVSKWAQTRWANLTPQGSGPGWAKKKKIQVLQYWEKTNPTHLTHKLGGFESGCPVKPK